jgi:hypothetical protein
MNNTRLLKTGIVCEGVEEILILRDDGYRIWVSWRQGKPVGEDYEGEHLWAEYKQCNFPHFSKPITDLLMNDLESQLKEQERIMAVMETEIESFSRDANDRKQACEKATERIESLELQVLGLTTDRAKLKALNDRLRGELNEIDNQDDYKQAIVLVLQRITTALGLEWHCSDYDPQDYQQRILAEIATLIGKNDRLRDVIDQNNKAFAQDNERLLAVLEDLVNKIDILEDNLDRSDSDRLAELTSIMRLIQALDKTPQANLVGALYLIKRVIYDTICKLDPSQAIDL